MVTYPRVHGNFCLWNSLLADKRRTRSKNTTAIPYQHIWGYLDTEKRPNKGMYVPRQSSILDDLNSCLSGRTEWSNFQAHFNTLRPRQNVRRFADDTFKRIFLNENVRISIKISLKFVPKGPINNIPALVQIMARRRSGDKPLSEPMMVSLLTHICVTRPQWVNSWLSGRTEWSNFQAHFNELRYHQWYCPRLNVAGLH